jgi:ribosomal protein L31E
MTEKPRPLAVEKMRDSIENKLANIRSVRLLEELRVFIWKNGKLKPCRVIMMILL